MLTVSAGAKCCFSPRSETSKAQQTGEHATLTLLSLQRPYIYLLSYTFSKTPLAIQLSQFKAKTFFEEA